MQTPTAQLSVSVSSTGVTLHFPAGLLGFSDVTEYALLDLAPDMPFKCLQAVGDHDLAFIVMDPLMLMPDYQVTIEPQDLCDLEAHDQEPICLLVILTIPQEAPGLATANLQGPILVNTENHRAKQLVLVQGAYHTQHPLLSLANAPA